MKSLAFLRRRLFSLGQCKLIGTYRMRSLVVVSLVAMAWGRTFGQFLFFLPEPRSAFWQNESIPLALYAQTPLNSAIKVSVAVPGRGGITLWEGKLSLGAGETKVWELPPYTLRPGRYELIAEAEGIRREVKITIADPILDTLFLFGLTGSPQLNAQVGSSWLPMIDLYNFAKVDDRGEFLPDPLLPSQMERGFESAILHNFVGMIWQGLWSGYVIHQPFDYNASYLDPAVWESAMQMAELGAQRARRFAQTVVTLGAMDEPGLNYGVVQEGKFAGQIMTLFPDRFVRSAYERERGKPLPPDPRTLSEEEWLRWFRWRAGIIPQFMSQAKAHFRRIPSDILWGQDAYASHALNDGTHPFHQSPNDIPVTHTFMFWRGACEQDWNLLLERCGFRHSRCHFASNTNYFVLNNPDERDLADVATNYLVMDGAGMLWHLNYREANNFQDSFQRLRRFGTFIDNTLPATPPIGVLFSFTEGALRLKDTIDKDNGAIYETSFAYAYACYSAVHILRRLGYLCDLIHEDELPKGGLKGRKAILLTGVRRRLPGEVVRELESFLRQGGTLLVDEGCEPSVLGLGKESLAQVKRLQVDFGAFWNWIQEREKRSGELLKEGRYAEATALTNQWESDAWLDEMADALAEPLRKFLGPPHLERSQRGIIGGLWKSGEGYYICLLNDVQAPPKEPTVRVEVEGKEVMVYPASSWGEAKEVEIKFNFLSKPAVAYLVEGRNWDKVRETRISPGEKVVWDFQPTEMKIVSLLPAPISAVVVQCALSKSSQKPPLPRSIAQWVWWRQHLFSDAPRSLRVRAEVRDSKGRRIKCAIPLKVTVWGAGREMVHALFRSTNEEGIYEEILPLSQGEEGSLRIEVEELFSLKRAEARVSVGKGAPQLREAPEVQIYDEPAIKALLSSRRPITIAYGSSATPEEKALAHALGKALQRKGVEVKIQEEGRLWRKERYPIIFPAYEKEGEVWVDLSVEEREKRRKEWDRLYNWAGANGYPPMPPQAFRVDKDLLLIGTDETSLLVKSLQRSGVLRCLANERYPGKGKGIVQYVWSPFSLGKDVILLTASERQGLSKAVEALLALLK